MGQPPAPRSPRLRERGVRIGELATGPSNAITDVPGVEVGHITVWHDEPAVARTGVTVVVPAAPETLFAAPVTAGVAVLNGAGELTGSLQIREWGVVGTPVYLTSTHAVGRIYDGAVSAAIRVDRAVGLHDVVIPVVGECDDSGLSDARLIHVEPADAMRALDAASGGRVEEGAVGAGTGMECFEWKGGIGTASRTLSAGATVGVLVLANFGLRDQLRVDGVPVGRLLGDGPPRRRPAGSCIAVVATDVPLTPSQAERLARRAGLGLARTGSVAHHGSGEIFLAFSTTARRPRGAAPPGGSSDSSLDGIFGAAVDATEEAVLNALWAAPTVTGRGGRTVAGLPHANVLELLDAHGRLRA
jgi:D-aminopeptidase